MYYPLFTTYVLIPYLAYTGFPLVFDKLEIQIEVNLIYDRKFNCQKSG